MSRQFPRTPRCERSLAWKKFFMHCCPHRRYCRCCRCCCCSCFCSSSCYCSCSCSCSRYCCCLVLVLVLVLVPVLVHVRVVIEDASRRGTAAHHCLPCEWRKANASLVCRAGPLCCSDMLVRMCWSASLVCRVGLPCWSVVVLVVVVGVVVLTQAFSSSP